MPSYTFCVQHAADKCLSMLLPAFTRFQSISGSPSFVCHNKARNSSELTKKSSKVVNMGKRRTGNFRMRAYGIRKRNTVGGIRSRPFWAVYARNTSASPQHMDGLWLMGWGKRSRRQMGKEDLWSLGRMDWLTIPADARLVAKHRWSEGMPASRQRHQQSTLGLAKN